MAVVALVVGLMGIRSLSATDAATDEVYREGVVDSQDVADIRTATLEMRLDVTSHALAPDAATRQEFTADIAQLDATITDALASLDTSGSVGDEAQAFSEALADYQDLRDTVLLPAAERGDLDAWRTARDQQAAPLIDALDTSLTAMVEADKEQAAASVASAHEDYRGSRTLTVVLLVAGLAVALALSLTIARGITRSLDRVRRTCEALADGDLTARAGLTSTDELGRMGRALDGALANLGEVVATIDSSSASLASAAEELSGSAQQIAAQAEQTESQAGVVSAAAEQVSRSTQSVAAGTQEMGASIREISRTASQAAHIGDQAVGSAAATSAVIARLGESSREIGDVVKSISAIAGQTNLLALNATIEAARAGQDGKGFAVVAGEVKDLAQETSRATEDIAHRVEAIQADTVRAVEAIAEISRVVGDINELQATIAAAVEEQTATTAEIGRNVDEAATGSGEIASNIAGVAQAAAVTREGSGESRHEAEQLAVLSSRLRDLVGQFRH